MRLGFALLVLPVYVGILAGCNQEVAAPDSSALPIDVPSTEAEKLQVAVENRTDWTVGVECLLAVHGTGMTLLGTKKAFGKGKSWSGFSVEYKPFADLAKSQPRDMRQTDCIVIHLVARKNDDAPDEREAYVTLPGRLIQKPGPRKTTLLADNKGVTLTLGSVHRYEPWTPTEH